MRKSLLLCALASLGACVLGGAVDSFGQSAQDFCPNPGTIVKLKLFGVVDRTNVWRGSDPEDPFVCLGTYGNGQQFRSLPGGYPADIRFGKEAIESGMKALLTESTDTVSFDFTIVRSTREFGLLPGRYTLHDSWKRLGSDTFYVDGKPLHVIRYLRNREAKQSAGKGEWDMLYDPSHHLFVKSVYTAIRGSSEGWFVVVSISSW